MGSLSKEGRKDARKEKKAARKDARKEKKDIRKTVKEEKKELRQDTKDKKKTAKKEKKAEMEKIKKSGVTGKEKRELKKEVRHDAKDKRKDTRTTKKEEKKEIKTEKKLDIKQAETKKDERIKEIKEERGMVPASEEPAPYLGITLYANSNFRGDSMSVNNDWWTLRGSKVGNNPCSIKISQNNVAILLYKKKNWNGKVMYLRHKKEISDLDDPDRGGKKGFGNSITSVRVNPFIIELNVTVVTGENGELPGGWPSRTEAEKEIKEIIEMTNDFLERQNSLLQVKINDLEYRIDEKRWHLDKKKNDKRIKIPASWKKSGFVNVIFVNVVTDALGISDSGKRGNYFAVGVKRKSIDLLDANGNTIPDNEGNSIVGITQVESLAKTFVHELFHHIGDLEHPIDEPVEDLDDEGIMYNMMTQGNAANIKLLHLTNSQIEDTHQKIARHAWAKTKRVE